MTSKPLPWTEVHVTIAGYVGQVMTILPEDEGLRALYGGGSVPQQGIKVQLGCPAAMHMKVAAWQVQEVLKILLGLGQLLRHKMLSWMLRRAQLRSWRLGARS